MTIEEDKIIMYDSPEAGRLVTVTVWEVDNPNGIIYTPKEDVARYNNCTHKVCECGKPMQKHYTKCEDCRRISANERYLALPYKEYDGVEYVVERDGDRYFWDQDELEDYMHDNEIEEIELLFCEPIHYRKIDSEDIAPDSHEDWEPSKELADKINKFNKYLSTLPPHSWTPGKIRTSHKIKLDTSE